MRSPVPKAMPATDPVTPMYWSNGKKLPPTKPYADPKTSRTPMNHIRRFNARGFHLDTSRLHSTAYRLELFHRVRGLCGASCTRNARFLHHKRAHTFERELSLGRPEG